MHDPAENPVADTRFEDLEPGNARNGNDNHSHLALGHLDRNHVRVPIVLPVAGDGGDSKTRVWVHHPR